MNHPLRTTESAQNSRLDSASKGRWSTVLASPPTFTNQQARLDVGGKSTGKPPKNHKADVRSEPSKRLDTQGLSSSGKAEKTWYVLNQQAGEVGGVHPEKTDLHSEEPTQCWGTWVMRTSMPMPHLVREW